MSSEPIAISVRGLSKFYQMYGSPRDRLKQFIFPRLRRIAGKTAVNYYREYWSLKDISFDIRKGETVGIIGRNGSGKSTLLQIICGTLTPSAGEIRTHGRIAALLELGSGFNPEFTGRENVHMNAAVLGLSNEQIAARFADIEAFADIGEFIDQPVRTYSSGMMVRLAFAVIAHVDADILVIDEALAVGDAFFTQKCMRFLRGFMKTGTVLFVSHDTGSVKNLCNRVIWLEKGSLQEQGQPKEVCELYLQAFYEAQQGKSSTTKLKSRSIAGHIATKDQRIEFINASNLRNDLQIFAFDPDSNSFGQGGAQITGVQFQDSQGAPLTWVVGGEQVRLRIQAIAHQHLSAPIIGFTIKDQRGQALFGDNTYLSYCDQQLFCEPGHALEAEFSFLMPILPAGDYSVGVAIADGTQQQHVQHHWVHDALIFKSEASSVATGLIGIPMLAITMEARKNVNAA
ncbi:MAG: ABC transporter ATP-binding protein [Burkholderiales bacterium]|nr:ABC transporter ATP-binding protein [Burkholderiales bacterium]